MLPFRLSWKIFRKQAYRVKGVGEGAFMQNKKNSHRNNIGSSQKYVLIKISYKVLLLSLVLFLWFFSSRCFIFSGTYWESGGGCSPCLHSRLSCNKDEDVMNEDEHKYKDVTLNNWLLIHLFPMHPIHCTQYIGNKWVKLWKILRKTFMMEFRIFWEKCL